MSARRAFAARRLALAAATLVTALLAACGGGGGGGGSGDGGSNGGVTSPPADQPPPPGSNFFPLSAGARWVYADYSGDGTTPSALYQMDVGATSQVGGHVLTSLVTTSLDANPPVGDDSRYLSTSNGLMAYPAVGANALDRAIGSYMLLKLPATIGDAFTQIDTTVDSGYDADGDKVNEQLLLESTVQVIDRGTVSTPAGDFTQALHLRTTLHETLKYSTRIPSWSSTVVQDVWLVDGVGRVRSTLLGTDDAGNVVQRERTELQAWRVGDAHGGAAPTVTSFAPADAAVHSGGVAVTAAFSMPMDPMSLSQGGFVVTDAAGNEVPGRITLDDAGRNAVFVPVAGWTSRVFTASITPAATDREGNAAAPQWWKFTLDTVAPSLALAWPATDATGIPADLKASFVFSEPLAPQTVWPGGPAFTIVDATTGVPADTWPDYDGLETITVAPRTLWTHGHTYIVTFPASFADLVGNTMGQPVTTRFTIAPGVFGPATVLAPDMGFEPLQAMADVDGDGLPDAVWATWNESVFPPAMHLYVRRTLPDGSLAAVSEPIAAPVYPCTLQRIAAVDLDADGRPDLVLGGSCGIRVYRQQAGGGFTQTQSISLPNYEQAGELLFADFDGDGRPDMLSVGDETYFRRWHQDASGQFVDMGTTDAGIGSIGPMRLADLDGDGVPDLVVTSIGAQAQRLSILKGLGGGAFGAPTGIDTGDGWPSGVSVADIDGDGRSDIVLSIYGSSLPHLLVLRQQPDHGFANPLTINVTAEIDGVALADVDGDGRLDAIVGHPSSLGVLLAQAGGGFGAEDLYAAPPTGSPAGSGLAVGTDAAGHAVVAYNGRVFAALTAAGATPQRTHRRPLGALPVAAPRPAAALRR